MPPGHFTSTNSTVCFDAELIRKYDQSGPRYTSYPTADRFTEAFTAERFVNALLGRQSAAGREAGALSLYVHLPFCDTICYYCACNKVVTKDHRRAARYLEYVGREIAMVAALIGESARVEQIHWGGGTPTFLSGQEMTALMAMLRGAFAFAPETETSIEIDPRKVDERIIELLASLGFNRMSVGVQDFDPAVQRAVNRIQSEAQTRLVIDAARAHGFGSVNVDLIYGLPQQTRSGFAATLDKVIASSPERIALYNYAHVPHLFKPQRSIDERELPGAAEKLAILELAIEKLTAAGYVYIGMDHFAKPGDELAVAQRSGKLHRNFQGYSTHADCDLLAFGVSAISKVGGVYAQNVRQLDQYYARIDAGVLPTLRGAARDADDLLRGEVIQRLMCDFALDFGAIEAAHGIRFAEYFEPERAALEALAADGLVELTSGGICVTPRGRLLVRSVAMVFDRYLREQRERGRYSRVI
jgi:oxygen-independent coproporphyrinogen-3 oxidase